MQVEKQPYHQTQSKVINPQSEKINAFKVAFPYTIPVLTGFLVLGMAYGILLSEKGYGILWAFGTSIFIFAGSMQFVSIGLIAAGFNPVNAAIMTLMVNARHIFYGISMLHKFRGTGKIKPYLIFGLCDETFSILCSTKAPEGVDKKWFLFFITFLHHSYWVIASVIGAAIGKIIKFDSSGMEFVLTALFMVIFINQWRETKNHIPVIIGSGSAIICRLLFGPGNFIIPSMIAILVLVTVFRKPIKERVES
jgi:4-azaleucine resistance transporter AzlC